MAKSKKSKNKSSIIINVICLILSALLVATFFMPTYTTGLEDNKSAFNGVVLTQAMFMSEEDVQQATENSLNFLKYNEEERTDYANLVEAYAHIHNEDNTGFKFSIIVNWMVLIAGIVCAVISLFALIGKANGLGLIISTLVGVAASVALLILTTTYAKAVYDASLIKDLVTITAGAGVWVALASSVLACGASITGKFLKK